jgi:arylsulfatase A
LSSLVAADAPTRPPTIVIVFTDDQGYADVGAFGARGFETPNLDRLAAGGAVYRNFHVAQPVCSASRAALMTGCYPNRIGFHGALGPGSAIGISPDETTLAELAKQRGYATAIFGKWHLGDAREFLPVRHGFDEYLGLPYSNDMWPLHPDYVLLPPETAKRKRGYPDLPLLDQDVAVNPKLTRDDQCQLTTWYTDRAVRFIEKHKDRPFLLYVAHSMPHVPLHVSNRFRGRTSRGLYGDVMAEIDWSVGRIMEALAGHGLEANTWVVFTSDNGPWLSYGSHAGSAAPLREGKGTVWEGGVRVPCVMRWPGRIPAGLDSKSMLMTIDLFPTIARRIGASLPAHPIDGRDVWPLLTGEKGATNPHASYWYFYGQNQLQAVVSGDGRWKLVLPHSYVTLGGAPGGSDGMPASYQNRAVAAPELYDLEVDLSETTNVAARHSAVVDRLMVAVEQARQELGDSLTGRTGAAVRPPGRVKAESP